MLKDRIDILLAAFLLLCLGAAGALLAGGGSQAAQGNLSVDKALQRDLAYQAKVSFLERLYAPVTELQQAGRFENALMKLDELSRRYPDESYGELLRGLLLLQLQSIPQAVEHLAAAVRMSGDYVDRYSPLSQRALLEKLIAEQLPRLKAEPASERQQAALKNLYYLQGRLAGGCE